MSASAWNWRAGLARIAAAVASWEGSEPPWSARNLVALTGDADPVVAYAAKEALQRLLRGASTTPAVPLGCAFIVRLLLEHESDPHGFRFALLRELISDADEDSNDEDSGSDDSDDNDSDEGKRDRTDSASNYYLSVMLNELALVEACIRCTFSRTAPPSSEPRQHEALMFLYRLIQRVQTVALPLSYDAAPSSVSCAVLNVMDRWHELSRGIQSTDNNDGRECYRECVLRSMQWFAASSCASMALRMIGSSETRAESASESAFIARQNEYPLLQIWLRFVGRLATGVMDTLDEWEQDRNPVIPLLCQSLQDLAAHGDSFPSRRRLLAVLSEQDDVMAHVLNSITYTVVKLEQRTRSSEDWSKVLADCGVATGFTAKLLAEFDPDLLFTDLLSTFAFDHLVLLDFLTSSETAMLEYLLRYSRRLASRWTSSRRTISESGCLDRVMSTLIRLRLEIERLVVAGLFPYDPAPLVRRLKAVEAAYEADTSTI